MEHCQITKLAPLYVSITKWPSPKFEMSDFVGNKMFDWEKLEWGKFIRVICVSSYESCIKAKILFFMYL